MLLLCAAYLLSLGSLAFEIVLARIFSINQWNHLSFMVISIALFGFAGSGTFLSIVAAGRKNGVGDLASDTAAAAITVFFSAACLLSFTVLNTLPLDYFKLPLESVQWAYLLLAYLMLALPFFFTGLVLSAAYAAYPERSGRFYFISMLGSACGAGLPALLLMHVSEATVVLVAALLPLVLIPFYAIRGRRSATMAAMLVSLLSAGVLAAAVWLVRLDRAGGRVLQVQASPYKALSQLMRLPQSTLLETHPGIRGRVDVVASPTIRFAPGLSLKYDGVLPPQKAVLRDADKPLVLYDLKPAAGIDFALHSLHSAGYRLTGARRSALVVPNGGGLSIACAMAAGVSAITVVEQHPRVADLLREHYRLPVVNRNVRRHLSLSTQTHDVIHIENWGASLPGAGALDQEYVFTRDAFAVYLSRLSAGGIIVISRKLQSPPSDLLRMWATALESLAAAGAEQPLRHLVLVRNWDTYALIVAARPIETVASLAAVARELNFDVIFTADATPALTGAPFLADSIDLLQEIERLCAAHRIGRQQAYFADAFLDVAPQTDDRPFPNRVLKWSRLPDYYRSTGRQLYALMLSSEIVVGVVFLEALLVAAALLVVPTAAALRGMRAPAAATIGYFLALGAGFMFMELYLVYQYGFLLGDPVISLTLVISAVLVFSAVGGHLSGTLPRGRLPRLIGLLAAVLGLMGVGLPVVMPALLTLPEPLLYPVALLMLAPAGILAGIPFPAGMRHLLRRPGERAHAWTANGCASVLASILAAQIALSAGISFVLAGAVGAYALAWICARRRERSMDQRR